MMTLVLEGLFILSLVLLPALLGVVVVRRCLATPTRQANFRAAEPVWAIAGGTFGLLLGFLVVNLWGDLQSAQATVQDEANDLVNIRQLTYGLPESAAPTELRDRIAAYARLLVDEEWPALGHHQSSPRADTALDGLWQAYLRLEPSLGATNASYYESIKHLSELQDARNRRINAARAEVPTALWVVIIGGVAVMISMVWFTGSDNLHTHILMTVVMAISLASILFLIRVFNNPFQGDVRVDAEPIERALRQFDQ